MFNDWCVKDEHRIGDHSLVIVRMDENRKEFGVEEAGEAIRREGESNSEFADVLERLGKRGAATYLRRSSPETAEEKCGNLSGALAVAFTKHETVWREVAVRLRWGNGRGTSRAGNEVLAFGQVGGQILLLKGEAITRQQLSDAALREAGTALSRNNGLPSPHALAFCADKLAEEGWQEVAALIDELQFRHGVRREQVGHMIFALTDDDPEDVLRERLVTYRGKFVQAYVGVCVERLSEFTQDVLAAVKADGHS